MKVLFSNNKWPFSKGMTLFLWLNAFKTTDCIILWLKTEDGNQLRVKVIGGKLLVDFGSKGTFGLIETIRRARLWRSANSSITL